MNKGLLDALVKELPGKLGAIFGLAPGKRDACTTWSRLLAEVLSEFGIAAEVKPVYARIANQAAIDYLQGKIRLEEARRRDGKIQTMGDIELGQEHQHAVCYIPSWNVIVDLTIEPRLSKLVPSHPYWAKWGEFPWWVRVFEFKNYHLEYRLYEVRPAKVKKAKVVIRDIVRRHLSQVAPQTIPSLEELKAKLAQYKSLTDLTARLNFPPPPKMAMRCKQCGKIYDYFQPTWEEVEFELGKGRDPLRELSGYCPECAGPEDEDMAPQTLLNYSKVPPSAY